MEKRFILEIYFPPYPEKGRKLQWHRKPCYQGADRDAMSASMCQVWEVQAVDREDALAKIIMGKGTKIFG
jgi:hypothetical protein